MKPTLILSFLVLIAFTSCDFFGKRVRGNGKISSATRSAGSIHNVKVSGAIDVYLRADSASSIRVETDENLLEYVETDVEGEVLYIHPRQGYNPRPTKAIKVYVSAPFFNQVRASGSCDVFSENKITSPEVLHIDASGSCDVQLELNAPAVDADLSGSCDINLKGETKDLKIKGSGSTGMKCMELLAENVNIRISGSGDAEVFASVKLEVHVSGSGSVKYKGNASVDQHISGSGSVKKVE